MKVFFALFISLLVESVAVADSPIPYTLVSSINPNAPIGVLAIVPTQTITAKSAASLARFAARQYTGAKYADNQSRVVNTISWKATQVFVFPNIASAKPFIAYQERRKSWPLQEADYIMLKRLWPKTMAFYEYRNKRHTFLYPSHNPSGWWKSLPKTSTKKTKMEF